MLDEHKSRRWFMPPAMRDGVRPLRENRGGWCTNFFQSGDDFLLSATGLWNAEPKSTNDGRVRVPVLVTRIVRMAQPMGACAGARMRPLGVVALFIRSSTAIVTSSS